MTAAVVIVGAMGVTVAVLSAAVWLIGRAEARHEASVRGDMRSEPPVLGGAPKHLGRGRWT